MEHYIIEKLREEYMTGNRSNRFMNYIIFICQDGCVFLPSIFLACHTETELVKNIAPDNTVSVETTCNVMQPIASALMGFHGEIPGVAINLLLNWNFPITVNGGDVIVGIRGADSMKIDVDKNMKELRLRSYVRHTPDGQHLVAAAAKAGVRSNDLRVLCSVGDIIINGTAIKSASTKYGVSQKILRLHVDESRTFEKDKNIMATSKKIEHGLTKAGVKRKKSGNSKTSKTYISSLEKGSLRMKITASGINDDGEQNELIKVPKKLKPKALPARSAKLAAMQEMLEDQPTETIGRSKALPARSAKLTAMQEILENQHDELSGSDDEAQSQPYHVVTSPVSEEETETNNIRTHPHMNDTNNESQPEGGKDVTNNESTPAGNECSSQSINIEYEHNSNGPEPWMRNPNLDTMNNPHHSESYNNNCKQTYGGAMNVPSYPDKYSFDDMLSEDGWNGDFWSPTNSIDNAVLSGILSSLNTPPNFNQ